MAVYIHDGKAVRNFDGSVANRLGLDGRDRYSTTIGQRWSAWCTCKSGPCPLDMVKVVKSSCGSMWTETVHLDGVPPNTPFVVATDGGRYAEHWCSIEPSVKILRVDCGAGLTAVFADDRQFDEEGDEKV